MMNRRNANRVGKWFKVNVDFDGPEGEVLRRELQLAGHDVHRADDDEMEAFVAVRMYGAYAAGELARLLGAAGVAGCITPLDGWPGRVLGAEFAR